MSLERHFCLNIHQLQSCENIGTTNFRVYTLASSKAAVEKVRNAFEIIHKANPLPKQTLGERARAGKMATWQSRWDQVLYHSCHMQISQWAYLSDISHTDGLAFGPIETTFPDYKLSYIHINMSYLHVIPEVTSSFTGQVRSPRDRE